MTKFGLLHWQDTEDLCKFLFSMAVSKLLERGFYKL